MLHDPRGRPGIRMLTENQFDTLLSIIDRHAGKRHGRTGVVAEGLREVLATHERMLMLPNGVWVMPPAPSPRTRIRDRDGVVWRQNPDEPLWVDLWRAPDMYPMQWGRLLAERGPLTEAS